MVGSENCDTESRQGGFASLPATSGATGRCTRRLVGGTGVGQLLVDRCRVTDFLGQMAGR